MISGRDLEGAPRSSYGRKEDPEEQFSDDSIQCARKVTRVDGMYGTLKRLGWQVDRGMVSLGGKSAVSLGNRLQRRGDGISALNRVTLIQ